MVEQELMRQLVDGGGEGAERCLTWLVDGAKAPRVDMDLMWPTVAIPW